jgi:hypothetical protein
MYNIKNMRTPRIIKQVFYIALYIVVFGLIIYQIVNYVIYRPTCTDGKMNQTESGIDCGGKCQPCLKEYLTKDLIVMEKAYVTEGHGRYDLVAKIKNPNSNVGSSSFTYQFILTDSSGQQIISKEGKGFILPSEEKYLLEIGISSDAVLANLEVKIKDVVWEEFTGYDEPDLVITNKEFKEIASGVGYYEVKGLMRNESAFDFTIINMKIILRDGAGKIIAVNTSEMRTINSGEERDFRQVWPNKFSGDVRSVEVDPEANVFQTETFMKKYLPPAKFQEYQYKK